MFRGKYMLVVLWASWCGPCRAEHPRLNAIYQKYKETNFKMIGVSLDKDKSKWMQAMIKDSLQWTQLIDIKAFEGQLAEYYHIETIPTNFLVDQDGKILAVKLTTEELEDELKKILK